MGSLGSLVTGGKAQRTHETRVTSRRTSRRPARSWMLVALAALLGATAAAVASWVALQYLPSELGDVMRIPAEQVFGQQGRERLGVGRSGLLLLAAVTPNLLVGGLVVLAAGLRGWCALAPPVLAVVLGCAGSTAALVAEADPVWQLAVNSMMAGAGAALGVAVAAGRCEGVLRSNQPSGTRVRARRGPDSPGSTGPTRRICRASTPSSNGEHAPG